MAFEPSIGWVDLGVLRVLASDLNQGLELLKQQIRDRKGTYFCFCEANLLSLSIRDAKVRQVLGGATGVFADGVSLEWLARIRGQRLPSRVPGPSFLLAACDRGRAFGWRHFFLGGAPGVPEALARRLEDRYPGLHVCGSESPPFRPMTDKESRDLTARIEDSRADLLWVGLGGPKQEFWMAANVGRIRVPVMLGVGAAFDFHSGNRPWAPSWVRKAGMEWAYRASTGGWPTFRRNVRCVSAVAWHLAGELGRRWLVRGKV